MKIIYLQCEDKKLFSWYRHDYQTLDLNGKRYMLDGGASADPESYIRYSGGELLEDEIKNLIEDIRECFFWTKNFDKDGNRIESFTALLKDLETEHILGILSFFNERAYKKLENKTDNTWHIFHEIFIQELIYRCERKRKQHRE